MKPSSHDSDELDLLLNRLADDALTADEVHRLTEHLRGSAQARQRYRHFMALHSALGWDYAAAARTVPVAALAPAGRSNRRPIWLSLAAAIALLASLAVLALRPSAAAPRLIATVEGLTGAVAWSGGGAGERPRFLAAGARIAAGTLTAEGDDASAQVRFSDGTRLDLNGESEIVFSDSGQKLVRVSRGGLDVQATAQASGKPVFISTPSAQVGLDPAGGSLSVSTDPAQTSVEIGSGRAQVNRLVDGQSLGLTAGQRALASLDVRDDFSASAIRSDHPRHWRPTLATPPAANCRGEWLPADSHGPARVQAVPCVAGRSQSGAPTVLHGLTARAPSGPLVALAAASEVTLRWRTSAPVPVNVMLGLKLPDGSFGGNFEVQISPDQGTPDAAGWRTVALPLSAFAPRAGRFAHPADGALVMFLFVNTGRQPADLEVADLAIEAPAA